MKLIIDSGGTKADWLLFDSTESKILLSSGLNPYSLSDEELNQRVAQTVNKISNSQAISEIYFYGAGCSSEIRKQRISNIFQKYFANASIQVEHDILGAARAVLGTLSGIAIILGTGSNCCLYDGKNITQTIGGLGYILGDEGSGAVLGKQILSDYLYNEMPEDAKKIIEKSNLFNDRSEIIDRVYNQKEVSKYLASFALIISENRQNGYFKNLVLQNFHNFFEKHILGIPDYQNQMVGAVGSIGYFFADELKSVAHQFDISMINIVQKPLEGLKTFHSKPR